MRASIVFAALLAGTAPALAQFRVEVSGVGMTQLPIAVTAFRGDDAAPRRGQRHLGHGEEAAEQPLAERLHEREPIVGAHRHSVGP